VSHPRVADLGALLEALASAGVEMIIVGGAAAVLHGAPITTQDLDIVHHTGPANLDRLLAVLSTLDAEVRDLTGRHLRPPRALLEHGGQLQLLTRLGPLDCLGRLHDGRDYDALLAHAETVTDGDLSLQIVDLPTLIEIKRSTGRAKDRIVVPILLALMRARAP
jgi:hypothetical protein